MNIAPLFGARFGRALCIALCAAACWLSAARVDAQIGRSSFRLSLDTDILSVASVRTEPKDGGSSYEATVIGVGPNQLGGGQVVAQPTPLGLGFAWAISGRILLGVRTGLGFDVVSDDSPDNTRVLALSLAPGLTFVPLGRQAKLFINLSPLFQVERRQKGDASSRTLLGGFSTGLGALIFAGSSVSVDLGFFFEGRFGGIDTSPGADERARDLRGLARLGLSLWK